MILIKRSLSVLGGIAGAIAVLIPATPIPASALVTSWDAAGDFSAVSNPSGAWSYGWSESRGSAFNPDTISQTVSGLNVWSSASFQTMEPDVFFNGTAATINPSGTNPIPAGTLAFHPGPLGQNAVVRWTAPVAGSYAVTATFTGRDNVGPTTTDVAVLSNGTQLFANTVNRFLATATFTSDPLNLNAGDTIDFAVGFGVDGNYFFDSTGLDAHITLADTTPPTVTITTPSNGASYVLNQNVLADYKCSDPDSTSVSCVGTVAAGSAVDTASVGSKTFTVVGTDQAGNTATASAGYTVGYGVCYLYDQGKAINSGATVPIKLFLCDAAGTNQSSAGTTLTAVGVTFVATNAPGPLDSPGNSQPDSNFRFDPDLVGGGGYHFNLSTGGLATGTYVLTFTVTGDPVVHFAQFEVR